MTDSPDQPSSGTAFRGDSVPGTRVHSADDILPTGGTPAVVVRPIAHPAVVVGRAVGLESTGPRDRGRHTGHRVPALSTA